MIFHRGNQLDLQDRGRELLRVNTLLDVVLMYADCWELHRFKYLVVNAPVETYLPSVFLKTMPFGTAYDPAVLPDAVEKYYRRTE